MKTRTDTYLVLDSLAPDFSSLFMKWLFLEYFWRFNYLFLNEADALLFECYRMIAFEYLIFRLNSIQLKKKTMLTTGNGNADINVKKNCDNIFFIFSFCKCFFIIFFKAFVPNLAIKSPGSNRFTKFCKVIKWTFFSFPGEWTLNGIPYARHF